MRIAQIVIPLARLVGAGLGVLAVLASLLILSDGITVGTGLLAASDYYFGSDVFEAKGGLAYRSRHHYLAASILEGGPLLFGGALALFGIVRKRLKIVTIGASLILVGIGANVFRMWCTESWFLGTYRFCD